MADRYYRLITLVVDVCTPVLRELFLHYAKADTSTPFIDIQQYMSAKKPMLRRPRGVPKHICSIIYDSGPIDEKEWDRHVITWLLLGMFSLPSRVEAGIMQIRIHSNRISHTAYMHSLSEEDYENSWRSIEQSISLLTKNVSVEFQQLTEEAINKIRIVNFPNICNPLTSRDQGMVSKEITNVARSGVDMKEKQVGNQESNIASTSNIQPMIVSDSDMQDDEIGSESGYSSSTYGQYYSGKGSVSSFLPYMKTDMHMPVDVTKTSFLPTQQILNELCVAFGRKSVAVLSTCENICKKLKDDVEAALTKKDCVADIYPAYCIDSDKEIVFVVTLKEEVDTSLLKKLVKYRIEIRTLGKPCSELTYCRKTAQLQEKLSIENQTKVQRCLSSISQRLLTCSKYLSVITASSVKSRCFEKNEKQSSITQQLCIVLCVHAKGFIPIDEDEFPDSFDGIPTDVMEGSFRPLCKTANEKHDNLRMGCEIHRKGTKFTGTLGGFIEHPEYGMCGIISAHVALHPEEFSDCKYRGGHLKLKHWPEKYVNDRAIYQPAAYDVSQPIGQLVEAIYIEGDNGTSGVDIAIFKITDRLPVDGTFPAQILCDETKATTLKFTSGMTTGPNNTSNHTLWKFGKTSGQTRGQMEFDTAFVSVKEIYLRFLAGDFQVHQYNLLQVTSTDDKPFAYPGDSGALVFLEKEDLVCVGVIEGGFEGGGPVFVSPINSVLKHCNVTQLKSFFPTQGEMAASISELQKQMTKNEQTMATNFSEILRKLEEIQQGKTTNNNANPDQ